MSLNKITRYILIGAVVLFVFGLGYKMGATQSLHVPLVNSSNPQNVDFSLFWDVWNTVQSKYVDKSKVSAKAMYYGAIKGMVASVDDPYTFFLTPDENKVEKDDLGGKFQGIGAQLGLKDNTIMIESPLKGSPAEKAGILSGDIIIAVNGTSTQGWSLNDAVTKIRGAKGTAVTLTILRNGEKKDYKIIRDDIISSPVETTYENNVAIVTLNKFGDDANADWAKAVSEVADKWHNKQIKGMVLDLRGNPGGYLESAVYIASEFLPMDKLIVRQQYSNGDKEDYTVTRQGQLLDIPLVVLIDEGSASAAEIVSGALHDYKRATLVGQKSFGKGSVQDAIDLQGGAGLHITIAKWILPSGKWINHIGIEPDIAVKNTVKAGNTLTRDQDAQLDKAIQTVLK